MASRRLSAADIETDKLLDAEHSLEDGDGGEPCISCAATRG